MMYAMLILQLTARLARGVGSWDCTCDGGFIHTTEDCPLCVGGQTTDENDCTYCKTTGKVDCEPCSATGQVDGVPYTCTACLGTGSAYVCSLDLEADTTDIPDNKSVDQQYTKADAQATIYNHKIAVTWDSAPMEIKVDDAIKWDYTRLQWVTDTDNDGAATLVEGTNVKTFTLTNYSAKAFTCKLGFTVETALATKFDSYTVVDKDSTDVKTSGVGLAAVTNSLDATETDKKYLVDSVVSYEKLPTATMTATVTPKLTGEGSFHGAAATTQAARFGTFTITCTVAGE